jgi:hypothetical protein
MMQFGPPPRKSRKRLVIALISGVVVVGIVAVVAVVVFSGGTNKSGTAADAVKGYLQALARGDARAALSYASDQPASNQFLTDDVLKKQIAKWPITNIRILSEESYKVHVAVNFGEQTSDENLWVKQVDGGGFRLKEGAIKLRFLQSAGKGLSTLTLFGQPFDGANETYVFPGWIDFGNRNPNIAQKPPSYPLLLNEMSGIGPGAESLMMNYDISDAGRTGIQSSLKAAIAECAKSTELQPANCPQLVRDPSLVDGTAQWTPPTDLSPVRVGFFDTEKLTVNLYGFVDFQLTAKSTSGAPASGKVTGDVQATADLTKNPPAITFK